MSLRSIIQLLIFCIYLSILASQTGAENHTWVGSKYQIECTMCATCDNPCNTPSSPPPPSPPPPSSSNNYPPPSPPSSGGNNYYYPPPSTPSQPNNPFYAPPPPYKTYPTGPTPPPPNPIVSYFPFYYHTPPPSGSSLSKPLQHFTLFLIITTLFTFSC
ncbi:hypothetical protein LIER_38057 [Lithospermum erythrorhizon]|uniref:Uncharacterized protein n=1 Tax=Lithospermum erythrorhizon TaxID=34254 RepID=A0AAV3PVH3_LITER